MKCHNSAILIVCGLRCCRSQGRAAAENQTTNLLYWHDLIWHPRTKVYWGTYHYHKKVDLGCSWHFLKYCTTSEIQIAILAKWAIFGPGFWWENNQRHHSHGVWGFNWTNIYSQNKIQLRQFLAKETLSFVFELVLVFRRASSRASKGTKKTTSPRTASAGAAPPSAYAFDVEH